MKRILCMTAAPLITILVLLGSPAICRASAANDTESAMARMELANKFYKQQKYEKAREIYEDIFRSGINEPALLYNLGNACARLGDTGRAIVYYHKAALLAPRDEDIRSNLRRLEPPINRTNTFFLFKPFSWLHNRLSLNEWTILCSGLFFLTAIVFGISLLTRNEKAAGTLRKLTLTALLPLMASGLFLAGRIYSDLAVQTAFVLKPDTLARSGPGEQFEELYKFPAGTRVRLIESPRDGWVRVRLSDGRSAYLALSKIQG